MPSDRASLFFRESNALDNLGHVEPSGQAMAWDDLRERASLGLPITFDDVLRCHVLVMQERRGPGAAYEESALRTTTSTRGASPAELRHGLSRLLSELAHDLEAVSTRAANETAMSLYVAAGYFFRFMALRPFESGNGAVGRLLANYIGCFLRLPLLVFPSARRRDFLAAHRDVEGMRAFFADLLRDAVECRCADDMFTERVATQGLVDTYRCPRCNRSFEVEWKSLVVLYPEK